MAGDRYDGGGISRTVSATRSASDDELRALLARVAEMHAQGTATVEIKSGYGLNVDHEARLLRLAGEVTDETTFLGAHVVPAGADPAEYLDLVTGPMLGLRAARPWIDVFLRAASPHAFDGDQARAVLAAGRAAGLGLRCTVTSSAPARRRACGGTRRGERRPLHVPVRRRRRRARRLDTVATLLPGVEFSTRSPYPDARGLIDAGVGWRWPPTVTPGRATPSRCRSSSPWPSARWGSPRPRRCVPPPPGGAGAAPRDIGVSARPPRRPDRARRPARPAPGLPARRPDRPRAGPRSDLSVRARLCPRRGPGNRRTIRSVDRAGGTAPVGGRVAAGRSASVDRAGGTAPVGAG